MKQEGGAKCGAHQTAPKIPPANGSSTKQVNEGGEEERRRWAVVKTQWNSQKNQGYIET